MKFKPGDILMYKETDEIVEIIHVPPFSISKCYLVLFDDGGYTIPFDFLEDRVVKIGEV